MLRGGQHIRACACRSTRIHTNIHIYRAPIQDQQDCLYVNFLVEGGPAHRCGTIQQGEHQSHTHTITYFNQPCPIVNLYIYNMCVCIHTCISIMCIIYVHTTQVTCLCTFTAFKHACTRRYIHIVSTHIHTHTHTLHIHNAGDMLVYIHSLEA